jgi:hypothetical protein
MNAYKSFFAFTALILLVCTMSISSAHASTTNNVAGHAWSSNIGWVKLNNCTDPANASTCTATDYGVSFSDTAPGTGSGMAWSSNIGWISFENTGCPGGVTGCTGGTYADWANPNGDGSVNIKGWARVCSVYVSGCSGALKVNSTTGGWDGYIALSDPLGSSFGVKINPTMSISGYAWGSDIIGWIQFTGSYSITDLCPNISGVQSTMPNGMVLDTNGDCVTPPADVCPNIAGVQATTPSGMIIDGSGNCVPAPTDVCPNIAGNQSSVPSGMIIDGSGNCVASGGDQCQNIPGIQTSVPNGMTADASGNCSGPNGDMCLNRAGVQLTIPTNSTVDGNGNCRIKPVFIEL